MKSLSKFLIVVTIILSCVQINIKAQTKEIVQLEEKAYIAFINSSIFMWSQIALEADKILNNESSNKEQKVKAIEFKYGFLYSCLSNNDEETYEKHLNKILEQIEILIKEHPNSSSLHTVNAGLMSIQMGFSPMKGMTLGQLSGKHIDKAISLDSLNADAWRQHASSKYFTPKMFGGDINVAIKSYERTIKLYSETYNTKDWKYLDALAWLGIAYEKNDMPQKAKEVYEKALSIEPEFTWIKNHLLPNLIKP